jgi:hypothetical protein
MLKMRTCRLLSLPQVKISLKRAAFSNSRRNSVCSDKELNNISKTAFLEGMKKLKKRAKNKCIDQRGMYFEK